MIRRKGRSKSIYHIVEKDESGDEDIQYQESSEKVASMDGKFFEQFIALRFSDGAAGQDSFKPIQDKSANNNSTIDFTQCRGIYKDIPRPTQREVEFFYKSTILTINQRLGVNYEVKELPNTRLFEYAQETLNISPQEHAAILKKVSLDLPPPLIMVVDVISAKGLLPKDSNGLSDPFCILGIVAMWNENMNSGKHKHARHDLLMDHASKDSVCMTEVQEKTLTPTWREQFRFDVGDVNNEQLQVEVWDHDEDSSVGKIMKNVGDVANLKGVGRFFKEIGQSVKKDGKNLDDFMGWVTIPLNTISSKGLECSFPLQSRGKKEKVEGELKLKLQLALKLEELGKKQETQTPINREKNIIGKKKASKKDSDRFARFRRSEYYDKDAPKASTEAMGAVHQYLWYNFTHHEVCDNSMTEYRWNGELPTAPMAILHQLAQQQQLPEIYQLASQWIAYSQQCVLPHLDLNVMLSIITGIANLWDKAPPDEQMVKYIHKSCSEFIDHSMRLLQKQHEAFPFRDTEAVLQLHLLLRCMVVIKQLSEKLSWGIFDSNVKDLITDAIKKSTKDWFIKQSLLCEEVHEARKNVLFRDDDDDIDGEEETEESKKVDILVNLIENMINHVKVQIRQPSVIYKKSFDIDFTRLIHMELAEKIMDEINELVSTTGKLAHHGNHQTAISLFSLYLAVRGFHAAADKSYRSDLATSDYHLVFKKSVEQWFELARSKAKARIQKAVEVDEVRLVDSMVKHSSSAVDVTTTFVQIKEFWNKLNWPDKSGAYVFIARVTDDIRQGAVDYANTIHRKLAENKFYDDEGQFDITDQLCIAVNNIEQVRKFLSNLPTHLDFERVLDGLLIEHGSVGSEQCGETLHTMLASADEDMLNVIAKVVRHVGEKMKPDFRSYTAPLMSAPPETNLDDVITPLMEYLDSNLITLHSCLLKANFQRILEELWLVVLNILKEMVNTGYKTLNQYPLIGQRMHDAFDVVGNFFHAEGKGLPMNVIECAAFKEAMGKLSKFGTLTRRLIEDYFMARVMQQEAANKGDSPLGILTVKCNYKQSQQKLRVRVMSATQIRPLDDDGLSDPYVIVYLQPHHVFPKAHFKKTQVVKKTLHPLFDETFEFNVPHNQVSAYGATVHFVLMDYDFLINDFGGEAYLQISDVSGVHGKQSKNLSEESPISLHLLPTVTKEDEAWMYIQTLKERSGDKEAVEFLKANKIK